MFENIERIKSPSREVFYKEYVFPQKPVILTDLFDGQPVREISSLEKGRQILGDMGVQIHEGHEEAFSRMVRGLINGEQVYPGLDLNESTVNGYLDLVAKDPDTRLLCSDVPSSVMGKLMDTFKLPDYCNPDADEDTAQESMLWLGNAGNYSHLHFDGDYRQLLQYQVWGSKRVVLAPPSAAKKLLSVRNNATLSPEGLTDAGNEEFVKYINGHQAVLRTGETIFMPTLMWHYFEYLDTSMSVTMRWRRNKYLHFLAESFHSDQNLQSIAWHLVNEYNVSPAALAAFKEIELEYAKPCDSPFEKADQMSKVFERLAPPFNPQNPHGQYRRSFLGEFEGVARRVEVMARNLYAGPESEAA